MKIDDASSALPTPPAATSAGARVPPGQSGNDTLARAADRVSLSDMLRSLASPTNAPMDAAKIDRLRAAIADGSFQINAGRIADGVITVSRDLLGSRLPCA